MAALSGALLGQLATDPNTDEAAFIGPCGPTETNSDEGTSTDAPGGPPIVIKGARLELLPPRRSPGQSSGSDDERP